MGAITPIHTSHTCSIFESVRWRLTKQFVAHFPWYTTHTKHIAPSCSLAPNTAGVSVMLADSGKTKSYKYLIFDVVGSEI